MEAFNLKMSFGFLIMCSLWVSFITGKPVAQEQKSQNSSLSQSENDTDVLKYFVEKIKYRISLGEAVAKYKWIEGERILDEVREKAVLESVKKMAENLNFTYQSIDQQFFIDLMEATKLMEYVLVSDWYGTKNGSTPTESASLEQTRKEISGMQEELIKLLFRLKPLQNSTNCQVQLADAISDTKTDNTLLKFALQRAFGNYCVENIKHKK